MKRTVMILAVSSAFFLATVGCGKNEKARNAEELERAFKPATDAAKPDMANTANTAPSEAGQIQESVNRAVSALKTNGYVEAFVTLRTLQAAPNLTLDQYAAVANARLAVEKELAAKALAGDANAQRAIEAIKGASRR